MPAVFFAASRGSRPSSPVMSSMRTRRRRSVRRSTARSLRRPATPARSRGRRTRTRRSSTVAGAKAVTEGIADILQSTVDSRRGHPSGIRCACIARALARHVSLNAWRRPVQKQPPPPERLPEELPRGRLLGRVRAGDSDASLQPANRGGIPAGSGVSLCFHGERHPLELGEREISTFVSHLASIRTHRSSGDGSGCFRRRGSTCGSEDEANFVLRRCIIRPVRHFRLGMIGVFALALFTVAAAQQPAQLVIANVRVFTGERSIERASMTVADGKIVRITADSPPTTGVTIDGAGKTALPGLIDSTFTCWQEHPARPRPKPARSSRTGCRIDSRVSFGMA